MGPPNPATLDEWREAFVRENRLRMDLLSSIGALQQELCQYIEAQASKPVTALTVALIDQAEMWTQSLAAIRQAHQP